MNDEQEETLLRALDTGTRIRLYKAAVRRQQWFRTPAEIYEAAGVSERRGEIELAKLVREGWLQREDYGAKNQERRVRFAPSRAAINLIAAQRSERSPRSDQNDRPAAIDLIAAKPPRSSSSYARGPAADPDQDPKKQTPPSVLGGPGGTDGRTVIEIRAWEFDFASKHWGGVTMGIVRAVLGRVLHLFSTARELREYMQAAALGKHPAFHGAERGDFPFATAMHEDRVRRWLASRQPAQPRERRAAPVPTVHDARPSHDELLEHVERARAAMAGGDELVDIPIYDARGRRS